MSFKSQNSQYLNRHERTHNDTKEFICEQCYKKYKSSKTLKQHIKNVHTEVRPYKCGTCGKTFKSQYSMRIHERIHKGEKSYQCDICEALFSDSSNLSRHRKTQHNIHINCKECKDGFNTEQDLHDHIDIKHIKKSYKLSHECYRSKEIIATDNRIYDQEQLRLFLIIMTNQW
ncbi:zinc finger protein 888-like [Mycetomoellerius zeteki]|uniref:zinc finger protein 888-like n=1 Tax=Mycetomoellerius zeteki TaxID=64791 RepID=UPI00084E61F9|nr:PREDICTED: zinc finger protein 888-like [Trachymyrmex zeteki]